MHRVAARLRLHPLPQRINQPRIEVSCQRSARTRLRHPPVRLDALLKLARTPRTVSGCDLVKAATRLIPPGPAPAPAAALEEFGRLDILVNNAGMGDLAAIEDTSLADWNRTIGIDQTGVFLGMKTAAAALAASGHGSVINISSIFGTSGGFGTSPAYHAAKGAVRTLTKTWRCTGPTGASA